MKLTIEKAIYGGLGLARVPAEEASALAGKAVFVPFTLPGEIVEAKIVEDKRSFATAELVSILEPSPRRITPGCEYVPRCGGCQYQHAGEDLQAQMKLDILRETLGRAHVPAPEAIGLVAGPAWGYRNRVRLQAVPYGEFALAYRRGGSHALLPVNHCPIAAPLLERAIAAVTAIGVTGFCEEAEFFTNAEQDQLQVSLWGWAVKKELSLDRFAAALQEQIPELVGVDLTVDGRTQAWGQPSLTYNVMEHRYQVSRGAFFQVNRFLVPELLALAVNGRKGSVAWDLFAGAGLFAQALDFEHVTAVESSGFSTADLKHNLAGKPHRIEATGTLEFLRNHARTGRKQTPDFIVVDPPRAGLGKETAQLLASVGAPEILYISCDPTTLSRDLQILLSAGYAIQEMHLVDLFPQTFHMETVTALRRR